MQLADDVRAPVSLNRLYQLRITHVNIQDGIPMFGFGIVPGSDPSGPLRRVHVDFRNGSWFRAGESEVEFGLKERPSLTESLRRVRIPEEGQIIYVQLAQSTRIEGTFTVTRYGHETDYEAVKSELAKRPLVRVSFIVNFKIESTPMKMMGAGYFFSGQQERLKREHLKPFTASQGVELMYERSIDGGKSWARIAQEDIWSQNVAAQAQTSAPVTKAQVPAFSGAGPC